MQNIYIFENTDSLHIEESLVTLLKVFKQNYNVSICLNSKASTRVYKNTEIMDRSIVLDTFSGLIAFLRSLKKDDIVIYPTISVRNVVLLYVLSFFISKNIYYIRNFNSWMTYCTHATNISSQVLSYIATFLKKRLLASAHQIFVANSNIKNYLIKNNVSKPINIVPYKFFEKDIVSTAAHNGVFEFVVPGGIDIVKKNLALIRKAVSLLTDREVKQIKITLLGKPSGEKDLDFCRKWKGEIGGSLEFYTKFIPDAEFSDVMRRCHFVLGILNINYQDKYHRETYGVSKDTGVDAQSIAYGKPLIINSEFNVIEEIKSSSLGYNDEDELASILKSIISDMNYSSLSSKAKFNCSKLSLESVIEKLDSI